MAAFWLVKNQLKAILIGKGQFFLFPIDLLFGSHDLLLNFSAAPHLFLDNCGLILAKLDFFNVKVGEFAKVSCGSMTTKATTTTLALFHHETSLDRGGRALLDRDFNSFSVISHNLELVGVRGVSQLANVIVTTGALWVLVLTQLLGDHQSVPFLTGATPEAQEVAAAWLTTRVVRL